MSVLVGHICLGVPIKVFDSDIKGRTYALEWKMVYVDAEFFTRTLPHGLSVCTNTSCDHTGFLHWLQMLKLWFKGQAQT